jgi:hypothetical protein
MWNAMFADAIRYSQNENQLNAAKRWIIRFCPIWLITSSFTV